MPEENTYIPVQNGNSNTLETVSKLDGFLINKGKIVLEPDFDNYDTHIDMCYEYSKNLLFDPLIDENNFGDILICTEWANTEEEEEE